MGTKFVQLMHVLVLVSYLGFTRTECNLIKEIFKCFMNDGFVLWPKDANIDVS